MKCSGIFPVRTFLAALLAFSATPGALANQEQPGDQPSEQERKPIIITTSPLKPTDQFLTPYNADSFGGDRILNRQASGSLSDALKEVPGVHVQKTMPGGMGSPFIRGLTAYRTLTMLDGTIRLNNSIWRAGPNQWFATVDQFLVEHMEVVRGPSSVMYGSDAMGGTMVVYTRGRKTFEEGFHTDLRTYYRFASADGSHVARQEFEGNLDNFGWLVGFTSKNFNEIDSGKHLGRLPETDYREFDGDGKFTIVLSEDARLDFGYQRTRQHDVPRVHRTIFSVSWRGTSVRPPGSSKTGSRITDITHERDLAFVTLGGKNAGAFFDTYNITLSWQHLGRRRFRVRDSDGRVDVDSVFSNTGGLTVHLGSDTAYGFLTYGIDLYHDNVRSDKARFPVGGAPKFRGRGSTADDAEYDSLGLFVQDEIEVSEDLVLTAGVRYQRVEARADQVAESPDPSVPFFGTLPPLDETYDAVIGNAKLLYMFSENWVGILGVSQSFRAPTLDDTTGIDTVLSGSLQIPALDIDPERTLQFEVGSRYRTKTFALTAFYYYTLLQDFLNRVPVGDVNGDGIEDVQLDNFNDGFVQGVDLGATWQVLPELEVYGSFNWAIGNLDEPVFDAFGNIVAVPEHPLSRVNPATGMLGVRWQPKDSLFWVEGLVTAVRRQDRLNDRDRTDTQRIPPGGTPGYTIFTMRGGYKLAENLNVTFAVENITNKDYRAHGSGQNEPGTNMILAVDARY